MSINLLHLPIILNSYFKCIFSIFKIVGCIAPCNVTHLLFLFILQFANSIVGPLLLLFEAFTESFILCRYILRRFTLFSISDIKIYSLFPAKSFISFNVFLSFIHTNGQEFLFLSFQYRI